MLSQAKKEVNGVRTRSLLNILGMCLSFTAIAALIVFFEFNSWTTLAGLGIIIVSVAISTIILYLDYRIIARNDFTVHPDVFLSKLKIYQLNKFNLYNRLYWIYAIALSVGFILYFYETLQPIDLWLQISIVAFTILWMALCATILRRAYMKREKERIDLLIEKFERISKQFSAQ